MNRVDLPWANTVFDVSGTEMILTYNDLQFSKKVCSKCHSNVKPIISCKKCGYNSCDACAHWAMLKGSRLIAAFCGSCRHRLGVLV